MNYYNEHDKKAAAWLRVLASPALEVINPGTVDDGDVQDVTAADLEGMTQCHFFAGIGGWAHALDLAGFPRSAPVWSASLPCQPWSSAGQQKGKNDERHLWPHFRDLVEQCRPSLIFGEQVSSKLAVGDSTYVSPKKSVEHLLDAAGRNAEEESQRSWFATVQADLEDLGYVVAASDLPAAGVGAPHIRQRLYWCAVRREGELPGTGALGVPEVAEERFGARGLGHPGCATVQRLSGPGETHGEAGEAEGETPQRERCGDSSRDAGEVGGLANGNGQRLPQRQECNSGAEQPGLETSCGHDPVRCGGVSGLAYLETGRRGQVHSVAGGGGEGSGAQGCERLEHCGGAGGMAEPNGCESRTDTGNSTETSEEPQGKVRGELHPPVSGGPSGTSGMAVSNGGNPGAEWEQRSGEQRLQPTLCGDGVGVAYSSGSGLEVEREQPAWEERATVERGGAAGGTAEPPSLGREGSADRPPDGSCEGRGGTGRAGYGGDPWSDVIYLPCADGKARPIKRGIEPLSYGVSPDLGLGSDHSQPYSVGDVNTSEARVMRLRGYGNAIVPELAAVFIRSVMETLDLRSSESPNQSRSSTPRPRTPESAARKSS